MPSSFTTDQFLELVRKSGVVEEKRLNSYLAAKKASSLLPSDTDQLGALLVADGILTNFQAEQLLQGRCKRFSISGKYMLLERLGSGGMGSVYLCEHQIMRRRVAIKVLPAAKSEDLASLERFHREARAVAALDHPNIVRAYDIDHDAKLHFLVMEYVDGNSLQFIVKKFGPMDVNRAAHYIRQTAIGLEQAQKAGLVHRDIKPGNILVDRGGTVKLLDMGLARFFNDNSDNLSKKHDENVLGTADYLAPEQVIDSHGVDVRADIYSLGVTFYFLLTGKSPFCDGTTSQKLIWHQVRQPKPIKMYREDVPDGIVAVVAKMMAKEPNERYQTPAKVMEALAPWTKKPIPPPPECEMPRHSPARSGEIYSDGNRSPKTMIASVGAPPFTLKPGKLTPVPPSHHTLRREKPQTPHPGFPFPAPGRTLARRSNGDPVRSSAPATRITSNRPAAPPKSEKSPEASTGKLATADRSSSETEDPRGGADTAPNIPARNPVPSAPATASEKIAVQAAPLTASSRRRLLWFGGTSVSVVALVLGGIGLGVYLARSNVHTDRGNPSGESDGSNPLVGKVAIPKILAVVPSAFNPIVETKVLRLFEGHTGFVNRLALTPDGKHVISAGSDNTLRMWFIDSGREVQTFRGHTDQVWGVAVSPNGKLAVSGSLDKTVRLWDLATGKEIRQIKGHGMVVWDVAFSPEGQRILSGSWDNTARIWSVATGKEICRLEGHTGIINGVAFSPDGRQVLTGSWDRSARLWDLETGKEIRRFEGHSGQVSAVAFSPNGKNVLTGSYDATLRLWDAESGSQLQRFEGHSDPIGGVAYSPDGKYVLSGSGLQYPTGSQTVYPGVRDYIVRLWEVETGKEIADFQGHRGFVIGLAFLPDRHRILSSSWDRTLRLWQLPSTLSRE